MDFLKKQIRQIVAEMVKEATEQAIAELREELREELGKHTDEVFAKVTKLLKSPFKF